jgi:hypothetical protein
MNRLLAVEIYGASLVNLADRLRHHDRRNAFRPERSDRQPHGAGAD